MMQYKLRKEGSGGCRLEQFVFFLRSIFCGRNKKWNKKEENPLYHFARLLRSWLWRVGVDPRVNGMKQKQYSHILVCYLFLGVSFFRVLLASAQHRNAIEQTRIARTSKTRIARTSKTVAWEARTWFYRGAVAKPQTSQWWVLRLRLFKRRTILQVSTGRNPQEVSLFSR